MHFSTLRNNLAYSSLVVDPPSHRTGSYGVGIAPMLMDPLPSQQHEGFQLNSLLTLELNDYIHCIM